MPATLSWLKVQENEIILDFDVLPWVMRVDEVNELITPLEKPAHKSSEDAQAAGYARFEKVWAR